MSYIKKSKKIFKTSLFLSIGKGIGFIVPIVVANLLKTSSTSDSFFLAYAIIMFFSGVFAVAIQGNIVPFYLKLLKKTDIEDKKGFLGYFFIK